MKSLVMALFLFTVSLGNYFTSLVKFLLINEKGEPFFVGADEFWFWTILMAVGSSLFILVSRSYVDGGQLQDA